MELLTGWTWLTSSAKHHSECSSVLSASWKLAAGSGGLTRSGFDPSGQLLRKPVCFPLAMHNVGRSFCFSSSGWSCQVALVVEDPPASAGDVRGAGLILGSRRSPGGGHGNPQYCVGFCHTSTGISHRYTYSPFLSNLPPTPSHPSRSSQSTRLEGKRLLERDVSPHFLFDAQGYRSSRRGRTQVYFYPFVHQFIRK